MLCAWYYESRFETHRATVAVTWTSIGNLALMATLLACGQILFKIAAQSLRGAIGFNFHTVLELMLNPFLQAGLLVYGLATLWWVLLLRDTALSKAYLVVAPSIVLVSIAGTFLFREPLSAQLLVGMAIILMGLAIALQAP